MRPAVLPLAVLLAACSVEAGDPLGQAGLANPASVHCARQGGRVVVRETPAGPVGDCHLPDGRVVEEWTLFRAAGPQP